MGFGLSLKQREKYMKINHTAPSFIIVAIFVIIAAILIFAVESLAQETGPSRPVPPMVVPLENPGFEMGTGQGTWWCNHYHDSGLCVDGPYHTIFAEVNPGQGWVAWWVENYWPISGSLTGRPEMVLAGTIPDAERVHSGAKAQKMFTFWRTHLMGLAQKFCWPVDPEGPLNQCITVYLRGQSTHALKHNDIYVDDVTLWIEDAGGPAPTYHLEAYMHSWLTECSSKPHSPPYWPNCSTQAPWAHDYLSVGLDITGGDINPGSREIVWSDPVEIYGTYGDPVKLDIGTGYRLFMPVFRN